MSTVTDMTITYDVDPLIEGSELSPVIDKDHRTFAINFNLEKNFEIFLDQEGKEKLNCYTISIENTIECKPTEEQMPETKQYKIYYKGACNIIKETGIVVSHQLSSTIIVSELRLENDTETTCSTSPFTQFSFSVDKTPNGAITEATLSNGKDFFVFKKCEISETNTKVTCSSPDSPITAGEYSLVEIKGVDQFELSQVSKTSIQYDDTQSPLESNLKTHKN